MYYCTQMTQTGRRFTQIFLFFLMLILRSPKKSVVICALVCVCMYYCTQMTQTGRRFTQIFLFFLMIILRSLKKICGHLRFSLRHLRALKYTLKSFIDDKITNLAFMSQRCGVLFFRDAEGEPMFSGL